MSHEIKKYLVLYCEDWNTNLTTSKHHFIERLAKENNEILYLEIPLIYLAIYQSQENTLIGIT